MALRQFLFLHLTDTFVSKHTTLPRIRHGAKCIYIRCYGHNSSVLILVEFFHNLKKILKKCFQHPAGQSWQYNRDRSKGNCFVHYNLKPTMWQIFCDFMVPKIMNHDDIRSVNGPVDDLRETMRESLSYHACKMHFAEEWATTRNFAGSILLPSVSVSTPIV